MSFTADISSTTVIQFSYFSAQWGFHPGGWGKPPLDEYNRPLYGDVFGVLPRASDSHVRHNLIQFLPFLK